MKSAYKEYWHNMTLMDGTATRSQYWWPQLLNYFVLVFYSVITRAYRYIDFMSDGTNVVKEWNVITILFTIITILIWLANFTVRARRLHDRNHSNWWILFYLIPIVGTLVIFITLVLPSKTESRWKKNQSKF